MRKLDYFLIIGCIILSLFAWRLQCQLDDARIQIDLCRADILQWSKLAQYSEEFHAVPDETEPIDIVELDTIRITATKQ